MEQLKSFLVEDNDLFDLQGQYVTAYGLVTKGTWASEDMNDIELVIPEYSGLTTRWDNFA